MEILQSGPWRCKMSHPSGGIDDEAHVSDIAVPPHRWSPKPMAVMSLTIDMSCWEYQGVLCSDSAWRL